MKEVTINNETYKVVGGLVWRQYLNNIIGFKPEDMFQDNAIVQVSYTYMNRQAPSSTILRSWFEEGETTPTGKTVFAGTKAECTKWFNRLCDKLISPNMLGFD